jgi:UDP-N-acetylmuramoyl-tripeptide--D-alanyl-D-alanine ligase
MRYPVKDLPALLRTPVGRMKFYRGVGYRLWPVISYVAMMYRLVFIRETKIVAVVGSFGKSTTMRAIIAALGRAAPEKPNRNSYTGVAAELMRTPPGSGYAVIEVGIDGCGQMARYARMLRPDITVVTSIGSEHHRSLKTLDVTRKEKSEMVKALPATGTAVINGDDPNVTWMIPLIKSRIIRFGFSETNDIRASHIRLDWPRGTDFRLHINGKTHDVSIRLSGRNGVYAALAAFAVALSEGFAMRDILSGLASLPPTPGRLAPIKLESGAILLSDEFKASLETIDSALDLLEEIPAKRKIVVMGEVSEPIGPQGPVYRRIGERIGRIASKALFLGGNFKRYAAGASRGGLSKDNIVNAGRDIFKTAEWLKDELKTGDVVLIKGRSEQRLDRIALVLKGEKVLCSIDSCRAAVRCDACPMLLKGWAGLKTVL